MHASKQWSLSWGFFTSTWKILIWILLLNCTWILSTANAPHVFQYERFTVQSFNHTGESIGLEPLLAVLFTFPVVQPTKPSHHNANLYAAWRYWRVIPKVITKFPLLSAGCYMTTLSLCHAIDQINKGFPWLHSMTENCASVTYSTGLHDFMKTAFDLFILQPSKIFCDCDIFYCKKLWCYCTKQRLRSNPSSPLLCTVSQIKVRIYAWSNLNGKRTAKKLKTEANIMFKWGVTVAFE